MQELEALMQEPPHGGQAGQDGEFAHAEGWGIVDLSDTGRGARGSSHGGTYGMHDAGMTAHRGVTHPDEYVDPFELRFLVCQGLGFTYEEITSVYRQGPLSATQRELRARIDARLLALSNDGGNMTELGRALGFQIQENGDCKVIKRALARAREQA